MPKVSGGIVVFNNQAIKKNKGDHPIQGSTRQRTISKLGFYPVKIPPGRSQRRQGFFSDGGQGISRENIPGLRKGVKQVLGQNSRSGGRPMGKLLVEYQ